MRTDANRHAKSMRTADAKPQPLPIAADWQPDAAGVREAQKRGLDLEEVAADFRDYYLHRGDQLSTDWGAAFRRWCRKETKGAPGAQRGMLMPIAGGSRPPKRDLLTRMLVEDIERQGRQAS